MKQIVGNGEGSWSTSYSFDASAKTVTITGIDNLALENILLINNATQNTIIYNPFSNGLGYTTFDGSTLTLEFDTIAHSDTDKLQIFYDNSDEANTKITELSIVLKMLVDVLATPIYYDMNSGGLRIGSGALTSVGSMATLSSLTNLTNMDNYNVGRGMLDPLITNAFSLLRDRITTS